MRFQSIIGVSLAATSTLALAACNPAKIGEHRDERPLVAAVRLDCPERQGDLTRTNAAGDGRSCAYTGEEGEEVTLQLMALNAKPARAVLDSLEAELKQDAPAAPTEQAGASAATEDGPTALPNSVDDDDHEEAHINLPGLHIDTNGNRAEINLPGVHINADGDKARVNVDKPGGRLVSINADDQGAEIRTGEVTARNVNATYLLATHGSDKQGERAVGYVARGPLGGPLVVGVVKSRGDRDSDDLLRSVKRLVRRNVQEG